MEVTERFNLKVDKSDECWTWTASTNRNGYGLFWFDNQMRLAHRVNWELTFGPVPDGLELDHLCMNRSCVNPSHLEAVTHRVNVGRAKLAITACPKGHPYSGDNLKITARGARKCAACHRETANRSRDLRRKGVVAW